MTTNELVEAVHKAMNAIGVKRLAALDRRERFARDVVLVALSVRCAYLVDAISLESTRFTTLLRLLQGAHTLFNSLVLVHESSTDQAFILNRTLLPAPDVDFSWATFVDVAVITPKPCPTSVRGLLRKILAGIEKDPVVALELSEMHPSGLIPLAGVLLEYPIAYVVPPETDVFLSHVPLDVYTCTVHFPGADKSNTTHTLLKFSCPAALAHVDVAFVPAALLRALQTRFGPRLAAHGMTLRVEHTTSTLPRVAL